MRDDLREGAENLTLSELTVDGARLRFALARLGASFEGKLDDARTRVQGTFAQRGLQLPLVLRRSEDPPQTARPQGPVPPLPYDALDVTFPNEDGGFRLAGTLTLPAGERPFPAAVLVSGSGQQDRDETIFGHRPFRVLADRLARAGIAALRYDDRGGGGSGGDPESATSADLATDAAAAVAFLRGDARIDPARIGIIGHSEGGLIGPLVAAEDDGIAFVVLWAGPGVPGRELLPRQTELIMAASGAGRPLIDAQLAYARRLYEILAAEPDDDAAAAALVAAAREDLPGLTDEQRSAWRFSIAFMPAGRLEQQAEALTSPWFRFFLEHDPRDVLARLACPVLGVWGGLDLQVEPAQNLPEVARALARARNEHYALVTLPGLNHLLQPASTGMVTEYGRTETTIAPEALELMTSWIAGVVATRPAP